MLTGAELLRATLFVAVVGSVYLLAVWFYAQSRKQKHQKAVPSRRFLWTRRLVYALATLGIGCLIYGRWIEPRWIEVTRVKLTSNSLPQGATLKIVHLSDFHCEESQLNEAKVERIVAAEHPDAIVFTGDLANSAKGMRRAEELLRDLSRMAPVYAVRGNWDYASYFDSGVYARAGVTHLEQDIRPLDVRGTWIQIAGADFAEQEAAPKILGFADPKFFTVLLTHTPDEIVTVAASHRANLYLAGHIHGGQVAVPFYGALVTLSRWDKRFEAGLYRVEDTYLYVSRGIGTEGGPVPKVRFDARPEVVVIEVAGTGEKQAKAQ